MKEGGRDGEGSDIRKQMIIVSSPACVCTWCPWRLCVGTSLSAGLTVRCPRCHPSLTPLPYRNSGAVHVTCCLLEFIRYNSSTPSSFSIFTSSISTAHLFLLCFHTPHTLQKSSYISSPPSVSTSPSPNTTSSFYSVPNLLHHFPSTVAPKITVILFIHLIWYII